MEKKNMDKQKANLINGLTLVIVMMNATLSFTEGIAFIDHSLVWATLSLAISLFALRLASKDKER